MEASSPTSSPPSSSPPLPPFERKSIVWEGKFNGGPEPRSLETEQGRKKTSSVLQRLGFFFASYAIVPGYFYQKTRSSAYLGILTGCISTAVISFIFGKCFGRRTQFPLDPEWKEKRGADLERQCVCDNLGWKEAHRKYGTDLRLCFNEQQLNDLFFTKNAREMTYVEFIGKHEIDSFYALNEANKALVTQKYIGYARTKFADGIEAFVKLDELGWANPFLGEVGDQLIDDFFEYDKTNQSLDELISRNVEYKREEIKPIFIQYALDKDFSVAVLTQPESLLAGMVFQVFKDLNPKEAFLPLWRKDINQLAEHKIDFATFQERNAPLATDGNIPSSMVEAFTLIIGDYLTGNFVIANEFCGAMGDVASFVELKDVFERYQDSLPKWKKPAEEGEVFARALSRSSSLRSIARGSGDEPPPVGPAVSPAPPSGVQKEIATLAHESGYLACARDVGFDSFAFLDPKHRETVRAAYFRMPYPDMKKHLSEGGKRLGITERDVLEQIGKECDECTNRNIIQFLEKHGDEFLKIEGFLTLDRQEKIREGLEARIKDPKKRLSQILPFDRAFDNVGVDRYKAYTERWEKMTIPEIFNDPDEATAFVGSYEIRMELRIKTKLMRKIQTDLKEIPIPIEEWTTKYSSLIVAELIAPRKLFATELKKFSTLLALYQKYKEHTTTFINLCIVLKLTGSLPKKVDKASLDARLLSPEKKSFLQMTKSHKDIWRGAITTRLMKECDLKTLCDNAYTPLFKHQLVDMERLRKHFNKKINSRKLTSFQAVRDEFGDNIFKFGLFTADTPHLAKLVEAEMRKPLESDQAFIIFEYRLAQEGILSAFRELTLAKADFDAHVKPKRLEELEANWKKQAETETIEDRVFPKPISIQDCQELKEQLPRVEAIYKKHVFPLIKAFQDAVIELDGKARLEGRASRDEWLDDFLQANTSNDLAFLREVSRKTGQYINLNRLQQAIEQNQRKVTAFEDSKAAAIKDGIQAAERDTLASELGTYMDVVNATYSE